MTSLEEKFEELGYDKKFICDVLMEELGFSCSDPNYLLYHHPDSIVYEIRKFNKGRQIRSELYELKIIRKRDSRELVNLVIKKYIEDDDIVTALYDKQYVQFKDLFSQDSRFLRFFHWADSGSSPGLVWEDKKNKILILRKYDGSLDDLIISLTKDNVNEDTHKKLKELLKDWAYSLYNNANEAIRLKEELEICLAIRRNDPEINLEKYSTFVSELLKYKKKNNINIPNKLQMELQKLIDYMVCKTTIEAVIHCDARSDNVLYNTRYNKAIELFITDFESIKLGPFSFSLASAVNDFYFKKFGNLTLDDSREIFDEIMMRDATNDKLKRWNLGKKVILERIPKLWAKGDKNEEMQKQLDKEFLYGTVVDCITRAGIALLYKSKKPEKYDFFIKGKPYEKAEDVVETKMQILFGVLDKFDREGEFYNLKSLFFS